MTKNLVPTSKIGTPFQSPSWRYQAVTFPEKFGFNWLCSRNEVDAGHLNRLIPKGLRPSSCYTLPAYFSELVSTLPKHLSNILIKVWDKHYFQTHRHKANFSSTVSNSVPLSLNIKEVAKLNDEFLKQLIFHCFNYRYDKYIEEAIKFYKDPENRLNKDWFNYSIYCGMTDTELASKWHKTVNFVRALRLIFFDYSHWPKDKLVHFSLVRQLVNNGELREPDYHIFRRIHDLGLLGLKSVIGLNDLNLDERKEIERYLGASSIDNILNLKFTVSNTKDALNLNKAISDFATVGLKRLEIEQRNELMRLTAAKMAKEQGMGNDNSIFAEEQQLIEELKDASQFDHIPKFPSFIALKAGETN
ncbi:hypothetical protein CCP3SC5AM1_1260002 [Gammaproteobacteria bacterium]